MAVVAAVPTGRRWNLLADKPASSGILPPVYPLGAFPRAFDVQPDIRKLLIVLARWSAAAKGHPTYQAKHGPPKSRRRVRLPVYSTVFCGRHNIRFFQSQWPAGATASKETDDLFAMLRPIKNQGGHRGHPGMVLINSSGLLNYLFAIYTRNPVNA